MKNKEVGILIRLPQELIDQLDLRLAEANIRLIQEGSKQPRLKRTRWVQNVVKEQIAKLK